MLSTEPKRRRRLLSAAALTLIAIGVFLLATAINKGGDAASDVSQKPAFAAFFPRSPHVLSSTATYHASVTPSAPRFPRTATFRLEHPIALYRAYAAHQLQLMGAPLGRLETALAANDRAAAQAAWRDAYARYLHLGAVYLTGRVAALNEAIDGTANGLEGGAWNPRFAGLHKLEHGLWSGAPPRSLLSTASQLRADTERLGRVLPHATIEPLEYSTRAHEILEDAQRDLLSGADVPWSEEGLLGTQAGLAATEEVISTLRPLLRGESSLLLVLDTELRALRRELDAITAAHGGSVPPNGRLTAQQSERLAGTLGGALEALAQVPGALETEPPASNARIPSSDVRIDR